MSLCLVFTFPIFCFDLYAWNHKISSHWRHQCSPSFQIQTEYFIQFLCNILCPWNSIPPWLLLNWFSSLFSFFANIHSLKEYFSSSTISSPVFTDCHSYVLWFPVTLTLWTGIFLWIFHEVWNFFPLPLPSFSPFTFLGLLFWKQLFSAMILYLLDR